jgi:integrase
MLSNRFFMLNFKALIQTEYTNAYESAYDLTLKKEFSTPKIYTANNDISKRWYVYFSYRNPHTGKLKRQTAIYGNANTFKTKEERLAVLITYQKVLNKLLKQGYNPYKDNTSRYRELNNNQQTQQPKPTTLQPEQPTLQPVEQPIKPENSLQTTLQPTQQPEQPTLQPTLQPTNQLNSVKLKDAFEFDLSLKSRTLRVSSLRSYKSHINRFNAWINKEYKELKLISDIQKKHVVEFLNHLVKTTSLRNRNNYRASLSSFYTTLEDNEMVSYNFIKNIKVQKTQATRNKTYTKIQKDTIFDYLETNDTLLLLFIKFVSYNFLRPIEVCRLKVGDLDLKNNTLTFKAKNAPQKTKIIPQFLLNDLPDLSKYNLQDDLFTPNGIGGQWNLDADSKRDYFSKRFKKVVKDHFNLGAEYGMYSFRHTYITKLYRALVKESSPFAAKSKLMTITGHTSMSALEKYLRDIDAELPEDYSNLIQD